MKNLLTSVAFSCRESVKLLRSALALLIAIGFSLSTFAQADAAYLATDKLLYPPGNVITITGYGYTPGETVSLHVTPSDGTPTVSPWTVVANGSGQFVSSWTIPLAQTAGDTLDADAQGLTSNQVGTASVMVGIGTNLDQLHNGTISSSPAWANGNINNTNSCYNEANAVPFRYFVEGATAGTKHEFTINFEWTKNNKHAFDYLTDYDLSEGTPITVAGGPCGSPNSPPGDCATPSGSFAFPNFLTAGNYTGGLPTDFFTTANPSFVLDSPRNLKFYNATIDSIGKYSFGGTASNREFNVKVYYTTVATGSSGFFWGGHLSAGTPTSWLVGNGSGSVSGAPFHMRAKDFDGGGGQNQDRSIQNGGVCLPPSVALSCAATDSLCKDYNYICSAPSGAATYVWSITGGTILSGQGTNSVTYKPTGAVGSTMTLSLEACNASSSCSNEYCCASVTEYFYIKDCNSCPEVTCHSDTSIFLCQLGQICIPGYSAFDPNNNLLSVVAIGGTLSGGTICFTPVAAGVHQLKYIATDSAGCADTCITNVTVTLNAPPVAVAPPSISRTVCNLGQICLPGWSYSDPNNNISSVVSVGGTYASGSICFTPVAGVNTLKLIVTDSCGAVDTATATVTVTLNTLPIISCPADTTVFLCGPGQVCRSAFSVSDPNNNIVSTQVSFGTLSGSQVCFQADTAGLYTIALLVTDSCGISSCQTEVEVIFNAPPVATCPGNSSQFVCNLNQICLPGFSASDPDNNIVSVVAVGGTYSAGQICFTPVVGANTVKLIATDACGKADTCETVVTVSLNAPPVAVCPGNSAQFVCDLSQICISGFSASDPNNNIASVVAVGGTYSAGQICFTPVVGANTLKLIVTDSCGKADTCETVVTVTLNSAPSCNAIADTTIVACAPTQICRPVGASDIDNNFVNCSVLSGPGTVSGGIWCYTPSGPGTINVTIRCVDACGAFCDESFSVTFQTKSSPVVICHADTAVTLCQLGPVCINGFSATDPDNDLLSVVAIGGVLSGNTVCINSPVVGPNTITYIATDSCGAADTCTTIVTVSLFTYPVIAGGTKNVALCQFGQVCFPLPTVSGGNGPFTFTVDGVSETGQFCRNFTQSETINATIVVTDACGHKDTAVCTIISVVNTAPVVSYGGPSAVYVCNTTAPICVKFTIFDPNNSLSGTSNLGTFNIVDSTVCFTASGTGNYCGRVIISDSCGLKDTVNFCVYVYVNQPPVAVCPGNITKTVCDLSPITVPGFSASDPNNNLQSVTVSIGSLLSGSVTFTPVAGVNTIRLIATDSCGAKDTCETTVTITLNGPPTISLGADISVMQCAATSVCATYTINDPDGMAKLTETLVMAPPGSVFDTVLNKVCIPASPEGTSQYSIAVRVTDSCGLTDVDTVHATVTVNSAPSIALEVSHDSLLLCTGIQPQQSCVSYIVFDQNGLAKLTETLISGPGTIDTLLNRICYTLGVGNYTFIVEVSDSCGAVSRDTLYVYVQTQFCPESCPDFRIEKLHNVLQGQIACVSITMENSTKLYGGFDLLIAYDQSALTALSVSPGQFITDCGWEYFTYRFGPFGNCANGCPSGLLRIVAVAETNNGANHPDCFGPSTIDPVEIAEVCFLVSDDRTLECQFAPIRFFWIDCGDNTLSNKLGDTLFVSHDGIYDYDNPNSIADANYGFPTYYGTQVECLVGGGPDKPYALQCVDFYNGGIDIVCADSIDARGDVNLNGLANEIADAVVFTQYFVKGLSAFKINAAGQTAATEINGDGIVLSVADLVYLIRVVTGDAMPLSKLTHNSYSANITAKDGVVSTDAELGAALFVFRGEVAVTLLAANMEMQTGLRDGNTYVIVSKIDREAIAAGAVVSCDGELVSAEVADYNGNTLVTNVSSKVTPTNFALHQNYPNPFNPVTKIVFDAPRATTYTLTVYNVRGQVVEQFVGNVSSASQVTLEWNAAGVSSGVYFYKLVAGDFTQTRKMALLK